MSDVLSRVKDYILQEFLPGAEAGELSESTPLISGGIMDSIATLRLVVFLQEEFDIELVAHDTDAENLDTLAHIVSLVESKLEGRP
jgi:acyl carrier protein